MTREQIASEIERFIANAKPDNWLVREARYKVDRFIWTQNDGLGIASTKFDYYLYKDRNGKIVTLGRIGVYFDGQEFNKPFFLDPDNTDLMK